VPDDKLQEELRTLRGEALSDSSIALIFFVYGLAFFSMGLAIMLEAGRGSDERLRHALRPLAAFGVLHGIHEWIEMLEILELLPGQATAPLAWRSIRIGLLAFSFLSLTAFGSSLLASTERGRRLSLLVPLVQAAIWGFGLLVLRGRFPVVSDLWEVADVWTRYILAVPSALFASTGLIAQQRAFRRAGMARFGRDSLWAAVAFVWYGVIGQTFTRPSLLPPSNVLNSELFLRLFGFPVQLLRAGAASVAAIFVIRFLRAFEVETQRQIAELQAARLEEAERREAMRGELLKRVVSAQEAERQRIARELHDETGQALTAIGLGLRAATTTLQKDEDKVVSTLRQLENLATHSLDELQRIIADLRPSHLDDLGLGAALRWYVGEVQSRTSLDLHVEIEGDKTEISPEVKTGLFRVAQEALTNVVKHADAKTATVHLSFGSDDITLGVVDDGSGFDTKIMSLDARRPSLGLMGMEERAKEMGGRFYLQSQPGGGTKVVVVIPYPDESEGGDDNTSDIGG
jgi:signal transduction histidine kinase